MIVNVNVGQEVTEKMIRDQLITAFEGGSNYWYEIEAIFDKDGHRVHNYYDAVLQGGSIHIVDSEEPDVALGIVDLAHIQNGLQLMANYHRKQFMNIITEDGDAKTADLFLQLVVMGEVIYG